MGRIHKTMTPAAEAANRANGAESTGPASEAGRQHSRMNALKHGRYAERPDPVELLPAEPSAEEETERQALRAEVIERYQPPDAFAEQAAEEPADLRFELGRLERVKQALWQRERELLELEQRRRAQAVAHRVQEVADQVSHYQVKRTGVMQAPESAGKYRELVVALEWLKVEMERRQFSEAWGTVAAIYGDLEPSWRGQKLMLLLHRMEKAAAEPGPEAKAEAETPLEGQRERQMERLLSMFRTMLADELREVREKLEVCELEQGPLTAAGQAMRLLEATSSRKWGWVRHQENFLRRSIDRKLRILIELRRDHAKAARQLADLKPASGGGAPRGPGEGNGLERHGDGGGEANTDRAQAGETPSPSTLPEAARKTPRNHGTNPLCAVESADAWKLWPPFAIRCRPWPSPATGELLGRLARRGTMPEAPRSSLFGPAPEAAESASTNRN